MHIVYVRLITYVLSTLIGMLPAAMAGFVTFNEAASTLTISVEGLVTALAVGLAGSTAVFKRWGVK